MRRFVLDTNIIMAYVRKNTLYHDVEAVLNLTADDAQLIVSVVTIGEIQVLAKRNGWEKEKMASLSAFLEQTLLIVDVTIGAPELLEAYVEIDIFSKGKNMGKNDLWIAATAFVTGATLVTMDKDFEHLDGTFFHLQKF